MLPFGREQKISEEICPVNMKTTKPGFSQLAVSSLGIISVLLMLIGSSMAAPAQASIGHASQDPLVSYMKKWIYANTLKLSSVVGGTQALFAQDRFGDINYDEYTHRIPGLPRPKWHQDAMSEKAFFEMVVKELFVFKGFIVEMKAHESQNKSSEFTARFQEIEYEINLVIADVQQLGYGTTQTPGSPQPTRKAATTQKEQDEWMLGVQNGFLMWLIPVNSELHQQTSVTTA